MRSHLLLLAAVLGSCAVPPPPSGVYEPRQVTELAGRIAGAPQRCIPNQLDGNLRSSSSDPGTLLYGNGSTIWANHLTPGCGFNSNDVLVIRSTGLSYCANDVVRSVDAASRFPGPTCILGDFIPYKL